MQELRPPLGAADDAAVLAGIAAGRRDALEVLYDRYGASCWSLARRVVVDPALAQDVVQDAFLAVWRTAGRYDGARGGAATWLLTLVHHKAVDAVRREQRQRRGRTGLDEAREVPSEGPSVEEHGEQALRSDAVHAALARLPEAQREVLVLAYYEGHTQREIAQLTGRPLGTVKTRTLAALRRLKDLLDEGVASPGAAEVDRDRS